MTDYEGMRARVDAATPGPWTWHEQHGRDFTGEGWSEVRVDSPDGTVAWTAGIGIEGTCPQADAEFMAARTDLPQLLDMRERLLDLLDGGHVTDPALADCGCWAHQVAPILGWAP